MKNSIKNILISTALVVSSTHAMAGTPEKVKVFDHTKTIVTQVPINQQTCSEVKVPIYSSVTTQGDAGGGALLGMILGGILGKGVTGDDGGAAAGAVIGGIVGANEAQTSTNQQIVGYEYETRCSMQTGYREEMIEAYSHSTIRFHLDGKRYVLKFKK